jgi:hypothetical protein
MKTAPKKRFSAGACKALFALCAVGDAIGDALLSVRPDVSLAQRCMPHGGDFLYQPPRL